MRIAYAVYHPLEIARDVSGTCVSYRNWVISFPRACIQDLRFALQAFTRFSCFQEKLESIGQAVLLGEFSDI